MRTPLFVAAAALLLTSSAAVALPTRSHASPRSEVSRLYALFKASDTDYVRRNPLESLFRGDQGSGDFGDYITDRYFAAERRAAERDLASLRTIDRAALTPEAQVAYDAFAWQRRSDLEGLQPVLLRLSEAQPID